MRPPQLVIFDCDGVLVDSERISHAVLQEMLAELGTSLTMESMFQHFMGSSTRKCLQLVESLTGRAPPAAFMEDFRGRTFAAFETQLVAVAGVEDLLSSLEMPYCVASNGPRAKMSFTLGHTGLLPRFAGRLFSADEVRHPKPAPDLFLHAAGALGISPSDCAVIEDSPTGVAAARAAGMKVYGYAAMTPAERLQEAGADGVFTRMSELPGILGLRPRRA